MLLWLHRPKRLLLSKQDMQIQVENLKQLFLKEVEEVSSTASLEQLKVKYLGKKGPIQALLKGLKEVAPSEIAACGQLVNSLKEFVGSLCEERLAALSAREEWEKIRQEKLDVTLPGRLPLAGRSHPVVQMRERVVDVLRQMGFAVQYGPNIDSDYYNFEALNFAPDHPAREMQDTFYLSPEMLLRTHTSNVQVRVMETQSPPIRIIAPGTVFRNEEVSARSHVFFHQVEALYIDRGVSFCDLLDTLQEFFQRLFQKEVRVRYRPSYFPFVEPGLEVDISCLACDAQGCGLCKKSGWLEVAGAGMVHPEVMKNSGLDPEEYTGFAWGLGIERLLMIFYKGIDDIRALTENDVRFLEQFTPSLSMS